MRQGAFLHRIVLCNVVHWLLLAMVSDYRYFFKDMTHAEREGPSPHHVLILASSHFTTLD